jgi:hypothetical protein
MTSHDEGTTWGFFDRRTKPSLSRPVTTSPIRRSSARQSAPRPRRIVGIGDWVFAGAGGDTVEGGSGNNVLLKGCPIRTNNMHRSAQLERANQGLRELRVFIVRVSAAIALGMCLLVSNAHAEEGNKENNGWHCERRPSAKERRLCEEARSAKPFAYEIRSISPGKGYALCERLLRNMRALADPPACGLKIQPQFEKYFSLPQWEELDPWADIDYLWKIDLFKTAGAIGQREIDKFKRNEWLEQFKKRNYEYDLEVTLKRARLDLNGDGKEDWVLAYGRRQIGCNPWAGYGPGLQLFVLEEDGKTPALELDPHRVRLSNQEPFISHFDDPRFPKSHVYRFYNTGGSQYSVRGSATTAGPSTVTACRYEIIKHVKPTSKK